MMRDEIVHAVCWLAGTYNVEDRTQVTLTDNLITVIIGGLERGQLMGGFTLRTTTLTREKLESAFDTVLR